MNFQSSEHCVTRRRAPGGRGRTDGGHRRSDRSGDAARPAARQHAAAAPGRACPGRPRGHRAPGRARAPPPPPPRARCAQVRWAQPLLCSACLSSGLYGRKCRRCLECASPELLFSRHRPALRSDRMMIRKGSFLALAVLQASTRHRSGSRTSSSSATGRTALEAHVDMRTHPARCNEECARVQF